MATIKENLLNKIIQNPIFYRGKQREELVAETEPIMKLPYSIFKFYNVTILIIGQRRKPIIHIWYRQGSFGIRFYYTS